MKKIQKKFKKGQGALEYLMTYGWAILIVSVMVILVWQWGFLQPKIEPATYGFWGVKPVDWQLQSGGFFKVVLTNEAGGNLTLTNSTIKIGGQNYNNFLCVPPTSTIESGNYITCSATIASAKIGTQYSLELSIDYTYQDQGEGIIVPHKSSGKIVGYYE